MVKSKKDIRRIALIRTDGLGDLVLSVPAIKTVLENFPDAQIDLYVDNNFKCLFRSTKKFRIIPVFKRKLGKSFFYKSGFLVGLLRQRYDLAVDLIPGSDHLSSLILFFMRSRLKCGYDIGMKKYFINMRKKPGKMKYETDLVFDIIRKLRNYGLNRIVKDELKITDMDMKNESKMKIDNALTGLKSPIIVVHPGVAPELRKKAWAKEKYSSLIEKLIKNLKANIVITGTKEDSAVYSGLDKDVRPKVLNLIGNTTVCELAYLISKADLVITNNTGPAHVTRALGTKGIIISGPSDPKRWGASTKTWVLVQSKLPCVPCEAFQKCRINLKCIKEISVDMVYEEARKLLAQPKRKISKKTKTKNKK